MKAKRIILASLLGGALLWGCSAEKVEPRNRDLASAPTMGAILEGPHPMPNRICGALDTIKLVEQNTGSTTVNYCGFTPCATGQPEWGWVQLLNNEDSMFVNLQLATGWFVDLAKSKFALSNAYTFTPNGIPEQIEGWNIVDVNPLVNTWQFNIPLNQLPDPCFDICLSLTVVKLSFFGGPDAASIKQLWGLNPDWNTEGNPQASTSPYLTHWCPAACAPDPADCTPDYTTYTQCQYGVCGGDGPAGQYRDANFATAFPNGLTIGCETGRRLTLTSAAAVNSFLPTDGNAVALTQNYTDPLGQVSSTSDFSFCGDIDIPADPSGTLDFDELPGSSGGGCGGYSSNISRGTVITNQWAQSSGITISGVSNDPNRSGKVIIFNSSSPTGGDYDLGTPNSYYGGPGQGSGGRTSAGRNNVSEGNILVLSENATDANGDGRIDTPDDDEAGGTITFDFDQPMTVSSLTLIDLDGTGNTITLHFADGRPNLVINVPVLGNNARKTVLTKEADNTNADKVTKVEVSFSAGGGIARLAYEWVNPYEDNQCVSTCNTSGGWGGYGGGGCGNNSSSCTGIRNSLAGELVTATLNVTFDRVDENFGGAEFPIGLMLVSTGPFDGMTVNEVLAEANDFIGGCGSTYTAAQLLAALRALNASFLNGEQHSTYLECPPVQL